MLLPVFKPYIRRADMDSVLSCLISDEIGPGKISKELKSELIRYLGLLDGFLFRDYYRAVTIALDALRLKSGSRIILSPLSPGVYLDVFRVKGIIPLFVDVEADSTRLDKSSIDKILNEGEADALLLFYPLGTVDDMEYYKNLGIPLIEDISENFGASFNDKKCGTFGKITIFSMEPDKLLTCGGGAAVFSNVDETAEILGNICSAYGNEVFLSDINAALALIQLKHMDENLEKRLQLAEIFKRALDKTEHKTIIAAEGENYVHFSFPVFLNSGMSEAKAYIMKKNIEPYTAFSRTALQLMENREGLCPVASGIIMRTLLLPLYPSLGRKNAEMISRVISTLP